jgi:uncharacterized Tic20 family protein
MTAWSRWGVRGDNAGTQHVFRAVQWFAAAYEIASIVGLLLVAIGIAVAGAVTDRLPMVGVGIALALICLGGLGYELWSGRRSESPGEG